MTIPNWINSLSDAKAKDVAHTLAPVLDAVVERVHYAEARRGHYVGVAAGLFAGAIALASLWAQTEFSFLRYPLATLAVCFFVLSLFLFYVHSKQVNRYPWTQATRTWKWFYRDALPDQAKFDISFFNWLFRWDKEVIRAKEAFRDQLPKFGESLNAVEGPQESLWQDVQQLYVLHINEKYKNAYLSQLRSVLSKGLIATVLLAVIAAAFQAFVFKQDRRDWRVVNVDSRLSARLDWAPFVGAACQKDCWVVNLSSENFNKQTKVVSVDYKGSGCLLVPGEGDSFVGSLELASGTSSRLSFFVTCTAVTPARLGLRVDSNVR